MIEQGPRRQGRRHAARRGFAGTGTGRIQDRRHRHGGCLTGETSYGTMFLTEAELEKLFMALA